MTSINFCYWLQGAFELFNPDELTDHQNEVINNHCEMVLKYDPDSELTTLVKYTQDIIFSEHFRLDLLKERINNVFLHEIDPLMGDEKMQSELSHLHNPNSHLNSNNLNSYVDANGRIVIPKC